MNVFRYSKLCDIITELISFPVYYKANKLRIERKGIMMVKTKRKRRAFIQQSDCVACGCCVKVCPMDAIQITKGIMAQVNMEKCVGCGKCARECPASVIEIKEVEA
ncbi:MAG: ATP-binding protein [Ruminococcus sp.]